jgi:kinesin family protein C2/C3
MFINCSPSEYNLSETHSTLQFGTNIRKIELGPASKHKMPPKPPTMAKK